MRISDWSSDVCSSDLEHDGAAHARHDDRNRQWNFHFAQALQRRHAHAARRFAQGRVNVVDGRIGIADDGKLGIQKYGNDRWHIADALAASWRDATSDRKSTRLNSSH